MRFLIAVVDRATGTADGDEMAAIDAFNDRLRTDGHWVFADGLESIERAVVIDAREENVQRRKGPFAPGDEFMAGFWVIEAPDRLVAERLATEASRACNRMVELRAFHHGGVDDPA